MNNTDQALNIRLLNQLRLEFDHLRWQSSPIKAQLIHKSTNADAEGVRGIPDAGIFKLAMQGAGYRDGGQKFDENGNPKFRKDPVLDADGTPIINSAGEAFDFEMPAHRSITLTGNKERFKDYKLLDSIVVRAGRVIANIKYLPIFELLYGWKFSSGSDF